MGLRPGDLTLSRDDEHVLAPDRAAARARAARPRRWPRRSGSRADRRWRRSRRSGGGCGATCTTGSGRGCPGSRSPPTRPATCCARDPAAAERAAARPAGRDGHRDRGDPAARLRDAAARPRRARPGAGPASAGGRAAHAATARPLARHASTRRRTSRRCRPRSRWRRTGSSMEALANVARHTPATTAAVRIEHAVGQALARGDGPRRRRPARTGQCPGGPASDSPPCGSGPPRSEGP